MDWLTFLSSLVHACAWPIAALILALWFRPELTGLIKNLSRFKYRDVIEAEFREKIEEVKVHAATIPEPTQPQTLPEPVAPQLTHRELASAAPGAAIVFSWAELEHALKSAYARFDISPRYKLECAAIRTIIYGLLNAGVITFEELNVIEKLRELRNNAAHGRVAVTPDEAISYVEAADRVKRRLNSLGPKL